MEFIEKRAKELYISSSGLSKSADQFGYGYPFLPYSIVFHNYYIPDTLTTLVNSTAKDREICSIKKGDVFLTRTSETTEELGMSCVALRDYANATFNGFAKRLRPITDEIVPEYAAYFFRSPFFRAQCMSMASLITRASLNDGMIGRFRIRYPKSKADQMKVGTILMNYDKLIEANNKRIKVLEQMAENLYKEWFVRFRFPGHETTVFENGMPKGWERARISKYYITSSGGTPSRETEEYYENGTIPWIKTGEMQDCLLIETEEKITEEAVKKSSAKLFSKDSVLMAMYGVNIGKLAYSTMDATCNQACCVFKDRMGMNTKHYLFHCLMSIRDYLLLISFGAAQQNLSQDLIKRIRVIRPNDATLIAFERTIEPLYIERKHLLGLNSKLIRQRDLLLPRLMSGKLEV